MKSQSDQKNFSIIIIIIWIIFKPHLIFNEQQQQQQLVNGSIHSFDSYDWLIALFNWNYTIESTHIESRFRVSIKFHNWLWYAYFEYDSEDHQIERMSASTMKKKKLKKNISDYLPCILTWFNAIHVVVDVVDVVSKLPLNRGFFFSLTFDSLPNPSEMIIIFINFIYVYIYLCDMSIENQLASPCERDR